MNAANVANVAKTIKNARVSSLITEAADLMRSIKVASERLDAIKTSIRREGELVRSRRRTDDAVVFDSLAGRATVVFVDDIPSLVKGTDPRLLKGIISDEAWFSLFRESVSLAPAFEEALDALPEEVQDQVKTIVVWTPATARVILPK